MSNEVSSATQAVYAPQSPRLADTRSAAHSESGKQVPPPGEVKPEVRADTQPRESDVKLAVEALENHARNIGRDLQFEIDSASGQTLIKVIDRETEEVVRQIPSEEAVQRARSLEASDLNLIDDIV